MEQKVYICDCCQKRPAVIKDFRDRGEYLAEYLVCTECLNLRDETFFKRMSATEAWKRKKQGGE